MRRKQLEADSRVKASHFKWSDYALTYFILLVLSAGQAMIMSEYLVFDSAPAGYIFGMLGYWAIVTAVFSLVTHFQKIKAYDKPMRILSTAAKQVAGGDFSVYLPPAHTADKIDYVDVMFEDFNTMVEELGSIETLKNDFIANVSHEIRTPLTSIRGYSEALLDGALSNPELAQKFLGVISTQADRLSRMVNDLLELSRLESGTVALIRTEIDLGKQIDRLREIFSGRLLERNIDLVCDFFIPFVYSSDESLMDLVLTNLLDNAIKYSHIGGTIRVKAERTDSGTTIQVKDEGVGIPREDMSRIFERFYRVDRARSSSVGGTGLGLSIVRHVVGLLQGKVEIRSDLGVGTTVRLSLPVI